MPDDDNDFLDGMCEPDLNPPEPWPDEHLDALVLFCDVYKNGRRAIRRRAEEWRELFGHAT